MNPFLLLLAATVLASGPGGGRPTNESRRSPQVVLVWRLKPLGISPTLAASVQQVLAAAIARLPGITLADSDAAEKLMLDKPRLASCSGQPQCLAELGRAAGAQLVVGGVVGLFDQDYTLDIKVVEVASGRELRRLAQSWQGEDDRLVRAMREMATRLLRPQNYRGWLSVATTRSGVDVYVDGIHRGTTPLADPLPLVPGRHAVRLSAAGYRSRESFIDIRFGETVPLVVELESLQVRQQLAVAPRDLFHFGVGLGLVSNTGALNAPQVVLDGGVRLPFWSGRLALLLASSLWGTSLKRQAQAGDLGVRKVSVWLLAWSLELQVVLRPLPDNDFAPFILGGPGFALVWQSLESEGLVEHSYRDAVFGFCAGAGLEYRLGPGALFLEATYRHQVLEAPAGDGGVGGLVGGLTLGLGYLFML